MTIKVLLGLTCLAAGWIAVLAGTMAWSDAAPAAFVPFPSAEFLAALPEHVAIAGDTDLGIILFSVEAELVSQLYDVGAWLVLPAGLNGCSPF